MTNKERMLKVLRGQAADRIPYTPRLDLWYKANKRAGTLPEGYRDASLRQIVDGLGAAMHAIVPDFKDLRGIDDELDRALGGFNLHFMPYRTVLENVHRTYHVDGDRTHVAYRTPAGTVTTTTLYNEGMRKAGITITHVEEYAFKGPDDYAALGHIFENAAVEPNYDGYAAFAQRVGNRGLAAGFVSLAASPMHLIQREIMPLDTFFFEMHDHPDQLNELARKTGLYWNRMMEVVAKCPAEMILVGANYDAAVTYPPFFARHIAPSLRTCARALHAQGKYLLTHTDGENIGLLDHYLEAEIDVADSICPKPMTKLSFKEVRDTFAGRITIMGGIPSVSLLTSTMSDKAFEEFLDDFFEQIGAGDHQILGVSDTTPPAADFKRLRRIGRRIEEFGAILP
ncbi:MAG: uroporphyrinogen decarboxylase family protein [Phycisphaerae bacterium]|nr:uroporphyrinogen decarboxylase family protein [Phycisphaerae bacterium]